MNYDENMLINRLKDGNNTAFEHLTEIYADKIYKTAYFMLNNCEDAKDAVQEVFLRIHKGILGFKGTSSLSTWIYRITVNCCISISRKRKFSIISLDDKASCIISAPAYEKHEDIYIVRKAILSLPEKYRSVVILRDINDLSYEAVSSVLKLPVGTVKSRLNRARSELRHILSDELFREVD